MYVPVAEHSSEYISGSGLASGKDERDPGQGIKLQARLVRDLAGNRRNFNFLLRREDFVVIRRRPPLQNDTMASGSADGAKAAGSIFESAKHRSTAWGKVPWQECQGHRPLGFAHLSRRMPSSRSPPFSSVTTLFPLGPWSMSMSMQLGLAGAGSLLFA